MLMQFTVGMLKSIENQIERCSQSGGILDVYKAAEIVRSENVFDNVALEDIVDRLVRHAGSRCAIEFLHDSASEIFHTDQKIGSDVAPLTNGKMT